MDNGHLTRGERTRDLTSMVHSPLPITPGSEATDRPSSIVPGSEATGRPSSIVIYIKDTGIGIAEADLPLLFNSFIRLESHLKIKTPGTGLGLYLTKKIATEMLGGSVWVESEDGKGSTFYLRIPKNLTRDERRGTKGRETRDEGRKDERRGTIVHHPSERS